MAYTPIRTIVITDGRLTESSDLTVPVSSFSGKDAYLVLEKNLAHFTIEIGKITLFESDIDLSAPINTAFATKLNDAFVVQYGKAGIPMKNDRGTYDKRLRVFSPVSYKGYKVQITSINTPNIVDDMSKKGFLDDLVISTREDISNMLVAVNGVFHKTTIHNGKLYVMDGFRTMRVSNRKDVTIVDTKHLGGHSIIPLTAGNVSQATYNGIATIKTGVSLRNKTVFLVVDGYFYHKEANVFYYADDKTIKVMTNKLPLIQQFRHNPRTITRLDRYGQDASQSSRKYSDGYDALFLNKRQVAMSNFTTLAFQLSRLRAYHSFLVVVDNPSVFPVSAEVLPTGTPQFYSDMEDRVLSGMMSYSAGLCPSYLILKDPFKRKSIFIQKQDNDLDWQRESLSPQFVPSLISDPSPAANIPARFVDYVSA